MRALLFLVGLVLGAGAALAYVWFSGPQSLPDGRPLAQDPPISVTLGEPFLTAIARITPSSVIEDVVVEAEDGVLLVKGNVLVFGRRAIATATMRPVVRDGELRIDVVDTELGALPVPMEATLQQQINDRVRAMFVELPVTITGVAVIRNRGVVITCRVDLAALHVAP